VPLYRAYGRALLADGPLPFRPCEPPREPDVRFVRAILGSPAFGPPGENRRAFTRRDDGWTLRYDASDGGWLSCDYRSPERRLTVSGTGAWEEAARPLAGIVWGLLLGLEGRTLLHGACLSLGGEAVAVLGASGAGKSTLAAALIAQGAELLSEDLLLLEPEGARFRAEAGSLTLGLLPDAWAAFGSGLAAGAVPRPTPVDGKFELTRPAPGPASAPLAAFYVLDPPGPPAAASEATRLAGTAAIKALTEQLYGADWIRPADSRDLAFCAALAAAIPVYALSRPAGLERVPETAAIIAGTVSKLSPRF
jgi:hypothetical protein